MNALREAAALVLTGMLCLPAFAAAPGAATAPAIPAAAPYKHLGVATCASTQCHGKIAAVPDRHVGLNEYGIWQMKDSHTQAFTVLNSPESRAIAAKLGLPNASGAKLCLDCHADNVPAAQRGPKFQLRDGVSCEACHGGAEKWIESHARPSAKHQENLALGMFPSEQPLGRARLCLSCHLGTRDRFATHAIMGAGHPRLAFELEAFTSNQPAHYVVDKDYRERKGEIAGTNLWVTGQLEAARTMLQLLQTPLFAGQSSTGKGGAFPELAFYDCHSCHHPMRDIRWSTKGAGAGIGPGTLRLQRSSYVMLQALSDAIGTSATTAALVAATDELLRAGQSGAPAVSAAAAKVLAWVEQQEPWSRRTFTDAETRRIRNMLLTYGADGRAGDYAIAEQVTLGVDSLSHTLGDNGKNRAAIDALYTALDNDIGLACTSVRVPRSACFTQQELADAKKASFSPDRYAQAARAAQGRMP